MPNAAQKIEPINPMEYLEEQDRAWPRRHQEIHFECCKKCPSDWNRRNGTVDPETTDLQRYPKEVRVEHGIFVCAWRPNKLCKGICDELGVSEEDVSGRVDV